MFSNFTIDLASKSKTSDSNWILRLCNQNSMLKIMVITINDPN